MKLVVRAFVTLEIAFKSVRKEGRKEEQQNCTLVASRSTPSTGALESFCEFFSCMQLEYCPREPLSKFEGLSTFYILQLYKREHFVLHIWDIRPIPTIRTTVRIIYITLVLLLELLVNFILEFVNIVKESSRGVWVWCYMGI